MLQDTQIAEAVAACTNCRLATNRGGLSVPAMPGATYQPGGIALFLEAPGADEERLQARLPSGTGIGKPLVGGAGRLMDQLLKRAGMDRDEVLVLNRIRCRPPRNRIADYPDAVTQCDDWVRKELDTYAPSIVVVSGNTAAKSIFGAQSNITSIRGAIRRTGSAFPYGERYFIPTFHPSYALRNGGLNSLQAKDIVTDLRLAKDLYDNPS